MEIGLTESLSERTPAWTMRVMLVAMRERGMSFDMAWASAIQRFRIQPHMSDEEADELAAWKAELAWARPYFEWCFNGATGEPPQLDGEPLGADLSSPGNDLMDHTSAAAAAA